MDPGPHDNHHLPPWTQHPPNQMTSPTAKPITLHPTLTNRSVINSMVPSLPQLMPWPWLPPMSPGSGAHCSPMSYTLSSTKCLAPRSTWILPLRTYTSRKLWRNMSIPNMLLPPFQKGPSSSYQFSLTHPRSYCSSRQLFP